MRITTILFCVILSTSGCTEIKIQQLIRKATLQESKKDNRGAIETYNTIITLDNKEQIAYITMGYLYMEQKEMEKAEESFQAAITIDNKSSRALLGLSRFHFEQKDYELALHFVDESIRLNPENIAALIHKGNTLHFLLEHEEAIKTFLKVVEIDENDIEALTGISTGYLAQEKNLLAEKYIRKSMLIDSTDCISIRNFAIFNYRIDSQLIACKQAIRAYDICKDVKSRNIVNQIKEKVCH